MHHYCRTLTGFPPRIGTHSTVYAGQGALLPGSVCARKAARFEVAAWEALWNNQLDWALTAVQRILDQLTGQRTPQRYAALWNYLGYSIAEHLARQTEDPSHRDTGARYYRDLQRKGQTSNFLAHLVAPSDKAHAPALGELTPWTKPPCTASSPAPISITPTSSSTPSPKHAPASLAPSSRPTKPD